MPTHKILYFAVETAPYLAQTWSKWVDGPVVAIERDWNLLCIAWQWEGERKVHVKSLRGLNPFDDKPLLSILWDLFDKADIVIGHNGNRFDIPKVQARFLLENYEPPSPFDSIDTLQVLRRHFKGGLRSNKLDEVCQQLDIGGKVQHTGFSLWQGCMRGDDASWKLMERYNKVDIDLLRNLYLKIRGWQTSHPTVFVTGCPVCGSDHFHSRGMKRRKTTTYSQYKCQNPTCKAWFYSVSSVSEADKPKFKAAVRQ